MTAPTTREGYGWLACIIAAICVIPAFGVIGAVIQVAYLAIKQGLR